MELTSILDRVKMVRSRTIALCAPLNDEDHVVQTMPDVSPTKWHLAHTTWFFETFLLKPFLPGYESPRPEYAHLFNSYYQTVGQPFSRPHRGHLSRPTLREVHAYRRVVDAALVELVGGTAESAEDATTITERLEVGIQHEQQHQELILTDIKHVLAQNPLRPVYRPLELPVPQPAAPVAYLPFDGGVQEIGCAGDGFCFDNEAPRHRVFLEPFALAERLVTNGDYLEFIDDGGYARFELWLADGWDTVQREGWRAPLYWVQQPDGWWQMSLHGWRPAVPDEPVCHVSFFEAEAYARWAGARLPTEAEWEVAAAPVFGQRRGTTQEDELFHPVSRTVSGHGLRHTLGEVWEWTASAYLPYPGFRPPPGALGEYNGKFMNGQRVLRGGSCATPSDHVRATYRNFFQPEKRWQFTGMRLARSQP